jgi:glycosylphosphatidylinositol deacylase
LYAPIQAFLSHEQLSTSSAERRFASTDYFSLAVEFNEDLSAFHGPTLDSEIRYTSDAISYVLSLYPPNTSIIVMGHSMGGIVAVSLLPSTDISAIITMSTPHTLPPARFDSRIDALYTANMRTLLSDRTPILSLCGGATDMMVPSESCILPRLGLNANAYRRTLFTTALEGAWTGVGHREMVWCHQVRWRVARAALELGAASTEAEQGAVLDVWLKDGHLLPPSAGATPLIFSDADTYETLPRGERLILNQPRRKRMYLLPSPRPGASGSAKFILFVSQGSIGPVAPYTHLVLRISVYRCQERSSGASFRCSSLEPVTLRLIPNPPVGKPFPSPEEGVDESEGVVLYEADIQTVDEHRWVGVYVDGADGNGWAVGGFSPKEVIEDGSGAIGMSLADRCRRYLWLTITRPKHRFSEK